MRPAPVEGGEQRRQEIDHDVLRWSRAAERGVAGGLHAVGRDLLQPNQMRPRRGDLPGQRLGAFGEVRCEHRPERLRRQDWDLVGIRFREQRIEVGAQVQIARHHSEAARPGGRQRGVELGRWRGGE